MVACFKKNDAGGSLHHIDSIESHSFGESERTADFGTAQTIENTMHGYSCMLQGALSGHLYQLNRSKLGSTGRLRSSSEDMVGTPRK